MFCAKLSTRYYYLAQNSEINESPEVKIHEFIQTIQTFSKPLPDSEKKINLATFSSAPCSLPN